MTKATKRHMANVRALGCIVCRQLGLGPSQALIHHVTSGGRRLGDMAVLPLCYTHHQAGIKNAQHVSRHPYKREFERRYGTEQALLQEVERLLGGR